MSGLILSRRDIFDPSHTFVGHGTNVVGVMGAGIAPLFARRYPGQCSTPTPSTAAPGQRADAS